MNTWKDTDVKVVRAKARRFLEVLANPRHPGLLRCYG
jgi:hypothetical protein